MNIRKELKVKQLEEIKKGKIAFIRYDRLVVKDRTYTAKEGEKRKRMPTDSPTQQDNENVLKAPSKINKTNLLGLTRQRTNSTPGASNQ